jgi:hypothetical protein
VPKRNYGFEKRQKEMQRQQKKEARKLRKQQDRAPDPAEPKLGEPQPPNEPPPAA